MDKVSDYESEDSRFESWRARHFLSQEFLAENVLVKLTGHDRSQALGRNSSPAFKFIYLHLWLRFFDENTTIRSAALSSSTECIFTCILKTFLWYLRQILVWK